MANVSSSNGLEKYPKLRFKGFSEPWETVRIGEVYAERSERGAEDMELLSVTMNDGVKMRSDIEGKDNSSEDKSNYKIVRAGDMVYNSMRMWQGANGISPWDGIVSPAYTVLKPRMPISNGFFAALFKTHRLINEFRKNSQGMTSDTWNLKYPQFETIKTCIPALAEQEKIADFLMALDQRIEKQRILVEHLKKYKRGVSNTFFNDKVVAECSAVLPFGQAVEINPKTKSLPTEFIYIDLESVESGKLLQENIISRDNAPSRAQRVLTKGDVLFQMVRPYQKNNFYFESELSLPAVASTGYAQIRCVDNDPLFVFEQISSDYFANEAMLRSTGTGYPAINADSLAEIPFIKHPIEEQRKIGKFLYLLSQRIIQEESKLEALLKVKGAMLQSLFI